MQASETVVVYQFNP